MKWLIASIIFALFIGMAGADPFMDLRGTPVLVKSINVGSGYDIVALGGASNLDYSLSSGIMKTPSGVFTMTNGATIPANKALTMSAGTGTLTVGTGGVTATSSPLNVLENLTLASGKSLAMSGASTVTTGTGAVALNGHVTMGSAKNIAMVGASTLTVGSTGITAVSSPLNVLENLTLASAKSLAMSGASTFTTGTGAVTINGDTTIAATKGITKTTGAGNFNFAAGTGFFNTTTGTNYINGNIIQASAKSITQAGASGITVGTTGITAVSSPLNVLENVTLAANKNLVMSGTSTITTGTGAIALNGDTTVATSKALAVTSADKLTVGGVIVPQLIPLTFEITENSSDNHYYTSYEGLQIVAIKEVHSAAGTTGAPSAPNLTVRICDDTEAVTAGINVTTAVINLAAAANTIQTPTINATNAVLGANDGIAFDFAGDLSALRGAVTIYVKRV